MSYPENEPDVFSKLVIGKPTAIQSPEPVQSTDTPYPTSGTDAAATRKESPPPEALDLDDGPAVSDADIFSVLQVGNYCHVLSVWL